MSAFWILFLFSAVPSVEGAIEGVSQSLRDSVSSMEYKARFIRNRANEQKSEVLCFELGGLHQVQLRFAREFWSESVREKEFPGFRTRFNDVVDAIKRASQFCYGRRSIAVIDKTKQVKKGNRGQLVGALLEIEKLSERLKSEIDQYNQLKKN